MFRAIVFLLVIELFFSCKNGQHAGAGETTQKETSALNTSNEPFFPVTNYLKGQISEIQKGGVNPLKYVTINNTTDSSWVKIEDLDKEVAPFLETVIDSSNIAHLFSEKKFLDQTINAYTFTYDPTGQLPDTFQLLHWDVYVDPVANEVKRIYMIKKTKKNKIDQLTWQSDKWFRIVTIATDKNDKASVEKEVLVKWDF